MNFNWKHKAGALALSAALLSVTATGPVEAKGKSARIEPNTSSVVTDPCKKPGTQCDPRQGGSATERNKSGRIEPTVAPPSTERGIKDNAIKGCSNCGVTGRVAAPPPADDGAAPAPSVDIETGQLLIKDKSHLPTAARRAHSGPGGTPPSVDGAAAPGSAEKVGRPKVRDDGARDTSATRKKKSRPKERDDPVSTRSSLLPVLGGVTALAALVVAVGGGGDDNPTSP